jgi:hypothetical protein
MCMYKKGLHGTGQICQCSCKEVCAIPIHTCAPPGELENASLLCSFHISTYAQVTEFWQSHLCPIEGISLWFKKPCLLGRCSLYGVNFLKLCPVELESDHVISWKCISYVLVGKNEDGQDKKAPSVDFKETPARDLVSYLKPKLAKFITHNFLS